MVLFIFLFALVGVCRLVLCLKSTQAEFNLIMVINNQSESVKHPLWQTHKELCLISKDSKRWYFFSVCVSTFCVNTLTPRQRLWNRKNMKEQKQKCDGERNEWKIWQRRFQASGGTGLRMEAGGCGDEWGSHALEVSGEQWWQMWRLGPGLLSSLHSSLFPFILGLVVLHYMSWFICYLSAEEGN